MYFRQEYTGIKCIRDIIDTVAVLFIKELLQTTGRIERLELRRQAILPFKLLEVRVIAIKNGHSQAGHRWDHDLCVIDKIHFTIPNHYFK